MGTKGLCIRRALKLTPKKMASAKPWQNLVHFCCAKFRYSKFRLFRISPTPCTLYERGTVPRAMHVASVGKLHTDAERRAPCAFAVATRSHAPHWVFPNARSRCEMFYSCPQPCACTLPPLPYEYTQPPPAALPPPPHTQWSLPHSSQTPPHTHARVHQTKGSLRTPTPPSPAHGRKPLKLSDNGRGLLLKAGNSPDICSEARSSAWPPISGWPTLLDFSICSSISRAFSCTSGSRAFSACSSSESFFNWLKRMIVRSLCNSLFYETMRVAWWTPHLPLNPVISSCLLSPTISDRFLNCKHPSHPNAVYGHGCSSCTVLATCVACLQRLGGKKIALRGGGWHGSPFAQPPPPPPWSPCREGGLGWGCPTCCAGGGGGGRPQHTWLKMIPTWR